jgi:hypothetical protein
VSVSPSLAARLLAASPPSSVPSVGTRVFYSDLSPWERATVVSSSVVAADLDAAVCGVDLGDASPSEFDLVLRFDGDDRPLPVQLDGVRLKNPGSPGHGGEARR